MLIWEDARREGSTNGKLGSRPDVRIGSWLCKNAETLEGDRHVESNAKEPKRTRTLVRREPRESEIAMARAARQRLRPFQVDALRCIGV